MEFSFPEDSKSSSEETDRSSEQNYDHTVTVSRSYECMFCKRGFTTAQALGGHMNIHRKDRATKTKPKVPPSTSTKVDYNFTDLGFYSAIRSPGPWNYYSTSNEVNTNYHPIFFSSMTHYREVFCAQNPQDRNLFGDDWRRSLTLHSDPLCVRENKAKVADSCEEDDGLDLELRLGYDLWL